VRGRIGLFLISLLSMIKSVSAAVTFNDIITYKLNFGFVKDVETWVFLIFYVHFFPANRPSPHVGFHK